MGYNVKPLPYKARAWKLRFKSQLEGVVKDKDIPEEEYASLGFSPRMTQAEAKAWCSEINAKDHIVRTNKKRELAKERVKEKALQLKLDAPYNYPYKFETLCLTGDKKQQSHWLACKGVLAEAKLPKEDWCFYKTVLYKIFQQRKYSYSYVQKILYLINLWGKFLAKEQKTYFEAIPYPTGLDKQRIIDAYEEKGRTASKPLSPITLQLLQDKFAPEQFSWLYVSVWFGLRPIEVDQLARPSKLWYIKEGVLWVYQTKLTAIRKEDRWKPIPLKYPEQRELSNILSKHCIKRPLNKTLQKYCGPGYTCYAGRKGFTDLMLERGNSLEAISQWMGHRSIDRTWKTYKDKKRVLL